MTIPSQDLLNASFLSIAAYQQGAASLDGYLSGSWWTRVAYRDFSLMASPVPLIYSSGGGFAAISGDGTTLAVSFRGSDLPFYNDYSDALFAQKWHYSLFGQLIGDINSYLSNHPSITKLLVTGHSLGGAMAEIYVSNVSTPGNITLITFGSPGVSAGARGPSDVTAVARDVLHVQHTGDLLTWVGGAVQGSFVQIDLPDVSDGAFNPVAPWQVLQLSEHLKATYDSSVISIAGSALTSRFLANPSSYRVVIDTSNSDGFALSGTNSRDFIIGYQADEIWAYGGDDLIDAGGGTDHIYGGNGNDIIYGGIGSDTVHYLLNVNQYNITQSGNHFIITPKADQPQGEGTDQIYEVESFDFNGIVYSAERLVQVISPTPNNPTPPSTSYGDTPGGGTFATQNHDIPDTTRSATQVLVGTPFINTIEAANDKDYVRVYLNQNSTYRIYLEGDAHGGYGALSDTFFRVRDGRDLSVLQPAALAPTHLNNHDQVVGNNARVDFVAPYTGLYFISIGAGGTNSENLTGGYRLSVSLIGTPAGEPTNQNPIAANFILDAQYGQIIGGNFLVAGSDPDGDVRGTDIINSLQTSRGGIVDVLANGAFQYHAPANGTDNATDTFTYTVRDGRGGSAVGSVSIQLHEPVPAMPNFTNGSDVVNIPVGGGPYYALDGNDVLIGSPGQNRVVFGGEGNDTFIAGGLGSHLLGGPGDDWFVASTTGGDNFINDGFGSPLGGNDTADFSNLTVNLNASLLSGTATAGSIGYGVTVSNIIGGSGNDRIIGYETDNLFSGGPGNDFLQGNGGNDNLYGGAGDDDLQSGDGDDNVFGGDGNDIIHGDFNTAGRDFLDGGAGDDVVEGGGGDDVLNGGDGDDGVFGEDGDDYIFASAGTDRLRGLEGIDTVDFSHAPVGITGGSGQITVAGWGVSTLEELEILIASPNNDDFSLSSPFQEVHLGAGNDRLSANGQAEVFGDDGNDQIFAQNVGKVFGGSGNDDLRSFGGNAEFHGDDGDDKLFGGGTNVLYGGAGDDQLFGGGTLYGDAGADQLFGSSSNDILNGGLGGDVLEGGSGADKFIFDAAAPADAQLATPIFDRVTDYSFASSDKLDLSAILAAAFAAGQSASALVRVLEDQSNTFATLQIDADGSANGANFITIARLDGLHPGDALIAILDASQPTGITISVAGGNSPPTVANAIADQNSPEDQAWSFQVPANAFSDIDGDALTYSAMLGDGATLPAWLSFNAATRTFSGTPPLNFNGTIDLRVTASDGLLGVSDTFTLTATPVNDTPTITSNGGGNTATISLREQTILRATVAASDPDMNALVYSIAGGADAGKFLINPLTGLLSFVTPPNFETPADADHNNSYVVQVRASDGVLSDTQTITVDVANAAEPNDFNGDGRSDLLLRENSGYLATWEMNGAAHVQNFFGLVPAAWHLAGKGDFNADTRGDLLLREDSGYVATWEMNGAAHVQNFFGLVPAAWHVEFTGDFNGDSKTDLLLRENNGYVAAWEMNGATQVQNWFGLVPAAWHFVGTGDFNGDGKTDLLLREDSGYVATWEMNGGTYVQNFFGLVPNAWHFVGSGDFNGDGKTDLLLREDNGYVATWEMNGGTYVQNWFGLLPAAWHVEGTGDFNGDGKTDLLLREDSGYVATWEMNGGTHVQNWFGLLPAAWHVEDTADFNGDGKTDLLLRENSGYVATWEMDGAAHVQHWFGLVPAGWHFV